MNGWPKREVFGIDDLCFFLIRGLRSPDVADHAVPLVCHQPSLCIYSSYNCCRLLCVGLTSVLFVVFLCAVSQQHFCIQLVFPRCGSFYMAEKIHVLTSDHFNNLFVVYQFLLKRYLQHPSKCSYFCCFQLALCPILLSPSFTTI